MHLWVLLRWDNHRPTMMANVFQCTCGGFCWDVLRQLWWECCDQFIRPIWRWNAVQDFARMISLRRTSCLQLDDEWSTPVFLLAVAAVSILGPHNLRVAQVKPRSLSWKKDSELVVCHFSKAGFFLDPRPVQNCGADQEQRGVKPEAWWRARPMSEICSCRSCPVTHAWATQQYETRFNATLLSLCQMSGQSQGTSKEQVISESIPSAFFSSSLELWVVMCPNRMQAMHGQTGLHHLCQQCQRGGYPDFSVASQFSSADCASTSSDTVQLVWRKSSAKTCYVLHFKFYRPRLPRKRSLWHRAAVWERTLVRWHHDH